MNIKKVEILLDNTYIATEEKDGIYVLNDIRTEINCKNQLFVEGNGSRIMKIKIVFEQTFSDDALILGDAWERAYGDLSWRAKDEYEIIPWYFCATDHKTTKCYGIKTSPNALCSWKFCDDGVAFVADIRSGTLPLELYSELEVCTFVFEEYAGDIQEALSKFCMKMCDNPRLPKRQIFGGNDWYCNYGDNSFEKILLHTKMIVECCKECNEKPYMVIDDGWELCHHQGNDYSEYYNGGPWQYSNNNFKDMGETAHAIESEGAIPGIWFRPLWTVEKFPKEYIIKSDGIRDTLDPSHPKVLEIVKNDIKNLVNWGYKLIKHDFTSFDIFGQYGFEMKKDVFLNETMFYDKSKTTAQIIKGLYGAIREAAGEDVIIMGCNTISHLAAGFFEIQRTGDDTSGLDFERTKKYGVNTLAFRMCQHKAFYFADADCVGITEDIPWEKNKQWLDVLAKSGTPLFVSIEENAFSDDVKRDLTAAFKMAAENQTVSKPIDFTENTIPERWESVYGNNTYRWW